MDKENVVSMEHAYGEIKDEDRDLILKPHPKHVLKSGSEMDPQLKGNSTLGKHQNVEEEHVNLVLVLQQQGKDES